VTSQPPSEPPRVREFVMKRGRRPTEMRRVLNWYMLPPRDYAQFKAAMDLLDTLPAILLRIGALEHARATHDSDHEERLRKLEDWRKWKENA